MHDLSVFQAPEEGKITICEKEGRLLYRSFNDLNTSSVTKFQLENYPTIYISQQMFLPNNCAEDNREIFLPIEVSLVKHLIQTYLHHGLKEVLTVLSYQNKPIISLASKYVVKFFTKINELKFIWNPCLRVSNDILIHQNSQTRNWSNSFIRCLTWHKDLPKLAVALIDDTVRIYMKDDPSVPIFRCREQVNISCLAWRPGSNTDLAVGCENGIIIWNVSIRASSSNAIKLTRVNHKPVLSLTWSPCGDLLASVAGRDSQILVWNIEMDLTESLERSGVSGYSLLKYSSDGRKLLTASTSYVFRIWDCLTWDAERWSTVTGNVQTACWSPCSNYLLFASSEEPIIYLLKFGQTDRIYVKKGVDSVNSAVPIYDVSRIVLGGHVVGGVVQSMEWDPKGHHLAVLFKECNYIAIFRVVSDFGVVLTPGFFIAGEQNEVPYAITFQPNFSSGACLTIGWSSGRIQYFPIEYTAYTNEFSFNQSVNGSFNSRKLFNKSYF